MTRGVNQRPKLWQGVGNLKFFHVTHIYEMVAIFKFFIMADANIPFLLTFRKPETQTFGGQIFEIFLYDTYLRNDYHFLIF